MCGRFSLGASADPLETRTLLTTTPNAMMRPLYHRMPVILQSETHHPWLDPDLKDSAALFSLLTPYPSEPMEAFPVSRLVNNPANDSPGCRGPRAADIASS
jgi:putative SOS response-associated peptidase YedK